MVHPPGFKVVAFQHVSLSSMDYYKSYTTVLLCQWKIASRKDYLTHWHPNPQTFKAFISKGIIFVHDLLMPSMSFN